MRTRGLQTEADFATNIEDRSKIIGLYSEYLETETMMPYDLIDKYVVDFVEHEKEKRRFFQWKNNHHPDLPFE